MGIHRKALQYSAVLKVLTALGVTKRVGITNRRAYQYEICIPNTFGMDFCRKSRKKTG